VPTVEGQHACKFIVDYDRELSDELTSASRQCDKATASGNQARQASTHDGAGDGRRDSGQKHIVHASVIVPNISLEPEDERAS
jgi:hypothetical protein